MEILILYKYLGEIRQIMLHDGEMSHISDMHMMSLSCVTTQRNSVACVVLIVPDGTSHASGMPS